MSCICCLQRADDARREIARLFRHGKAGAVLAVFLLIGAELSALIGVLQHYRWHTPLDAVIVDKDLFQLCTATWRNPTILPITLRWGWFRSACCFASSGSRRLCGIAGCPVAVCDDAERFAQLLAVSAADGRLGMVVGAARCSAAAAVALQPVADLRLWADASGRAIAVHGRSWQQRRHRAAPVWRQ